MSTMIQAYVVLLRQIIHNHTSQIAMYINYSHMLAIELKQLSSCLDMWITATVCSQITIIEHELLCCGITTITWWSSNGIFQSLCVDLPLAAYLCAVSWPKSFCNHRLYSHFKMLSQSQEIMCYYSQGISMQDSWDSSWTRLFLKLGSLEFCSVAINK